MYHHAAVEFEGSKFIYTQLAITNVLDTYVKEPSKYVFFSELHFTVGTALKISLLYTFYFQLPNYKLSMWYSLRIHCLLLTKNGNKIT